MIHELYMKRENRDARYKELKMQGHDLVRTVHANQLLHPQYVVDYPIQEHKDDNNLGNTRYKTHFAKLYCLDTKWQGGRL